MDELGWGGERERGKRGKRGKRGRVGGLEEGGRKLEVGVRGRCEGVGARGGDTCVGKLKSIFAAFPISLLRGPSGRELTRDALTS